MPAPVGAIKITAKRVAAPRDKESVRQRQQRNGKDRKEGAGNARTFEASQCAAA
jgi:hypothetical protein